MSTGFIENTAGPGAARYARKRAAMGKPVQGHSPSSRRPGWVTYALLLVVFVVSVFPLYASAMYGSSTTQEISRAVGTLPKWFPTLTLLGNFREVLSASQFNFWMAFANSVLVAVAVSASTVFFSTLAGFSFAKLTFRGRQALYLTVIATLAIPAQVGTIPMFVMMNDFGWIDSLLALTVPGLVGAFGVFWMTSRRPCLSSSSRQRASTVPRCSARSGPSRCPQRARLPRRWRCSPSSARGTASSGPRW